MKLSENVQSGSRKKWFDFGGDPDTDNWDPDNSKMFLPILMNLSENVRNRSRKEWLDFGGDPDKDHWDPDNSKSFMGILMKLSEIVRNGSRKKLLDFDGDPDPDLDLSYPYPDHHQNLITFSLTHFGHFLKVSSKSARNFLSYVADRQTNPDENIYLLVGGKLLSWLFWRFVIKA